MSKQTHIKWLLEELPLWKQEGIIDEQTEKKLASRYAFTLSEKGNLFTAIFASLASVLIGVGIISLFATNWEAFDKTAKTIISFVPLVVGAVLFWVTVIKKSNQLAWRESTSGFLMLAFGASMGLVSQIYHLGGTLDDFLTAWLLFSLPLVYILRSYLTFVIYTSFAIILAMMNVDHQELLQSWLIPLTVLPYLILQLKNEPNENKTVVSGWLMTIAYGTLLFANFTEAFSLEFVMMSLLASMLYLIGKYYHGQHTVLGQPMQVLSAVTVIVLTFTFTFVGVLEEVLRKAERSLANVEVVYPLLLLVFLVVGGMYFVKLKDREEKLNPFIVFSPVVFLTTVLLPRESAPLVAFLFVVYLFAFGLFMVYRGVHYKQMLQLNVGMFVLGAIILSKFFEVDVSLTIKGVVSILIGVGFLATNVVLSKQLKTTNDEK
jgi:uncharacterized membrane protein